MLCVRGAEGNILYIYYERPDTGEVWCVSSSGTRGVTREIVATQNLKKNSKL